MVSFMRVGLIANPASSKDIRRLTGLARVMDIEEKANLVARLLVGLGSIADVEVIALDDAAGLVKRAVRLAGSAGACTGFLDLVAEGVEADTRKAAGMLRGSGAAALVTVGGDGTVRAAAEGWPQAPLVPLAAGTNNAFALTHEPTVIGFATARALVDGLDAFVPTTAVEVDTTEGASLAVIDAVAVRDRWVGAGAIFDPASLVEGLVTSARRTAVGVASIAAALGPLRSGNARWIRFGGGSTVSAVFGPGVVLDIPVAGHDDLPLGSVLQIDPTAGLVALDGERRLPAAGGQARVVRGPRVIDLDRALP
jgi:predicted polyphosphate/ATP-dependent NAD kinase